MRGSPIPPLHVVVTFDGGSRAKEMCNRAHGRSDAAGAGFVIWVERDLQQEGAVMQGGGSGGDVEAGAEPGANRAAGWMPGMTAPVLPPPDQE